MKYSKLESYLTALERELVSLSTGERAEIILEIKSHVEEKLDSDSGASLEQVLADLGSPTEVAMRYMSDKGIEYKAQSSDVASAIVGIFKWSVIGLLGSFGIVAILALVLVFSLSPIVQVDEEKGKVKILGGMIDISENDFDDINIDINKHKKPEIEIIRVIDDIATVEEIQVLALDGKLEIENNDANVIKIECQSSEQPENDIVTRAGAKYSIDLKVLESSNCEVELPSKVKLDLQMNSGVMRLDELKNPTNVSLNSGRIKWKPERNTNYSYKFEAVAAKIDSFESSSAENSYPVSMKINSGKIKKW